MAEIETSEFGAKPQLLRPVFLCNPECMPVVREFLIQFFRIYDANERTPLLNAYHPEAMFSLTLGLSQSLSTARLDFYLPFNHDIRRATFSERLNHLIVGPQDIVQLLERLPQTLHVPESFNVDVMHFSSQLLACTITGMFKEYVSLPSTSRASYYECRYFMRSFVIVPWGSGYCIRNEQLHIAPATVEQKWAFDRLLERRAAAGDATIFGSGADSTAEGFSCLFL